MKKELLLWKDRVQSFLGRRKPGKSRFSQRKIIWSLIGIVIFTVVYFFGILPFVEAKKKAEEDIIQKKKVLQKYGDYLQNSKVVEEDLNRTLKQYEGIQQKLFPGETPQLGAAQLQEVVKRLSDKNGMFIRSFRILESKEINSYRKISLQIDFNPTNSMLNVAQFIHDIEHYEKELVISEMDLLVPNMRVPHNVQGSMVISGLMKGSKIKENKIKEKRREG